MLAGLSGSEFTLALGAMEAALAGTLQWLVLRRQVRQAGWWVPVAVAGHAVAAPLALCVVPDARMGLPGLDGGGGRP